MPTMANDADAMPCPRCAGTGRYGRPIFAIKAPGRLRVMRVEPHPCAVCAGTGRLTFPPDGAGDGNGEERDDADA